MKKLYISTSIAIILAVFSACDSESSHSKRNRKERKVSRADFPKTWPFIYPSGILVCEENAVFFWAGGKYYAVTGNARGTGKYLGYEVLKFDEGWNHMGDRSEILDAGKALCK